MTRLQWVVNSLVFHWRIHFAVALGVAAATAVLTGALLVGDSVRLSLRGLTLERLGKIDSVLVSDRFFRRELAAELAALPEFQQHYRNLAAVILFPQATLEHQRDGGTSRASSVLVMASEESSSFWDLDDSGVRPRQPAGPGQVVVNAALAAELGVTVGDAVTLRLPKSDQVPADSPLANRDDRIENLPGLKVSAIIPTKGLGRFNLQPSQSLPLNAFVSLATIQNALQQPDRVNAILVGEPVAVAADSTVLDRLIRPRLTDLGVNVKPVIQTYQEAGQSPLTAFEYFTVTTDRMIFAPQMSAALEGALGPLHGVPVLTYLANSITRPEPNAEPSATPPVDVPYSMITAIDFSDVFPLLDASGQRIEPLADDEIVLNAWTAGDLQAKVGDRIRVKTFEPETAHGDAVERSADFRLRAITPLMAPVRPFQSNRPAVYEQRPTLANDPDLTPEVKGVTDQDTIENWNPPFPFDYQRIRKKIDDDYWESYRTTPKAFVSTESGRKLWGSRFGQVTSYRVPAESGRSADQVVAAIEAELSGQSAELGLRWIPIRHQQLEASRGATPFDVLFLSLSFFVIAAALLLVSLLYRLGIEQRAREIGTLLAVGFTRRSVGRLFVVEGSGVAAVGALLGILGGMAYARLMLAGLSTWWLGAISVPFLTFHWQPRSLISGWCLGVIMSIGTIAWSIRETRRTSVRRLLSGQVQDAGAGVAIASPHHKSPRFWRALPAQMPYIVALGLSLLLSIVATQLGGMAQAGAFVGSGAGLLLVLLLALRRRLRSKYAEAKPAWETRWLLWSLAERSAARNPTRSLTTVALMATATFLIVAMSSFRLAPTARGTGGFRFVGRSAEPIYEDLGPAAKRDALFGSRASILSDVTILGLRLRHGDDASCQNLYQAAHPRVLGVTPQFTQYFDSPAATAFSWAGSAAESAVDRANPWRLLGNAPVPPNTPVPVVLDKNTALYSLHLYRGIGEEFSFEYDGQSIRFRVAGFLENSVLQGSLLMGEADFRQQFPSVSGFRFFLVAVSADKAAAVNELLENRFSDQGLDVTSAQELLEQLLAVQNSYLSTFQSLGALGLLLGVCGLAAVQLRNVLERKSELALLRAIGYQRKRLAQVVLLENVVLLVMGLLAGSVAATLAVVPHKLLGDGAVSWLLLRDLAVMLGIVLLAGLLSSTVAARSVLRLPLLSALRGE